MNYKIKVTLNIVRKKAAFPDFRKQKPTNSLSILDYSFHFKNKIFLGTVRGTVRIKVFDEICCQRFN